jgi:hypothetical protein
MESLVACATELFAGHCFHNLMLIFFKLLFDILRPCFFRLVRLLDGWISGDSTLLRQVVKQI